MCKIKKNPPSIFHIRISWVLQSAWEDDRQAICNKQANSLWEGQIQTGHYTPIPSFPETAFRLLPPDSTCLSVFRPHTTSDLIHLQPEGWKLSDFFKRKICILRILNSAYFCDFHLRVMHSHITLRTPEGRHSLNASGISRPAHAHAHRCTQEDNVAQLLD